MDPESGCYNRPAFRKGVIVSLKETEATITLGTRNCSFEFPVEVKSAVARLLSDLNLGGYTLTDLSNRAPEIADQVPNLLTDFDQLRLLTDRSPLPTGSVNGPQLYRELHRLANRVTGARSSIDILSLTYSEPRYKAAAYRVWA
jgi:hypothetical protein